MSGTRDPAAWHRQPVAWLAAAIFVATLAGCIATILIAMKHADVPVESGTARVMTIPLATTPAAPPQERR
jgi:predicted small integral membrane protein